MAKVQSGKGSKWQRFKVAKVQSGKGSKWQRFKDVKIQRCKDSKVQRRKDSKIQRFEVELPPALAGGFKNVWRKALAKYLCF